MLTGRVELGDIVLHKPAVTIVQAADGRLNIASLGGAPPSRGRPVGHREGAAAVQAAAGVALATRIKIDGGQVTYAARGPGERIAQYRLEGLDLTLTSGGPQIAFKGDARLQPGAVALKVSDGLVTLGPRAP